MDKRIANCVVVKSGNKKSWVKWLVILLVIVVLLLGILIFLTLQNRRKPICLTPSCVRTAASLLTAMDLTADPCEDFFQFACGNWNKLHIIPEDRSSISTFEVLADSIQVILKGLLEQPVNDLDTNATKKAKDFYKSCMNLTTIRRVGEEPLKKLIGELGGWPVVTGEKWKLKTSIENMIGQVRKLNMGVLIDLWIGPDDKNSTVNIIQVDQMQLGLPSRDYFLNVSKETNGVSRAYYNYMVDLAILFGAEENYAKKELEKVIEFETQLAQVSIPEADRHDSTAIYKKHTLSELKLQIPTFKWNEYLSFLNTSEDEPIVSYAFDYLKNMAVIVNSTESRTVQNYVVWRVMMELTQYLIDVYQEKKIEFRKILMGVTSERSRWNQCVEWTNKKLGMALGALFIKENFNDVSKETAQEMISNIRSAFIELLNENHWMDEMTREVAREKAIKMNERIGYPEFLTKSAELNKEYENLTISEHNFINNIIWMGRWKARVSMSKLHHPVDKTKWNTEPAVVNAFYDPNRNDIVFPAGILQPLFYSQHFPKSLNYGGIGVVIGHEITHGFDDKGRQFDSEGNLKEWWNNETIEQFRTQANCIINQYNGYQMNGHSINGKMTQGENIADNGGLKQAYRAFKKWESRNGEEELLPGLEWMTHDQYFFLNYAQIWCGTMREEDVLNKIRSAVHSPGPIRVLGPLSNSIDFSNAYHCPSGLGMNTDKKCVVW